MAGSPAPGSCCTTTALGTVEPSELSQRNALTTRSSVVRGYRNEPLLHGSLDEADGAQRPERWFSAKGDRWPLGVVS